MYKRKNSVELPFIHSAKDKSGFLANIYINSLSKLAQAWKDKEVIDYEAKEIYKTLNILKIKTTDIEPEEELRYITGNGNSWTELRVDTNLTREERIAFKKVVGFYG